MDGNNLSYWTKRRKIEATVVRNMESLRRRVLESNSTDILSPMLPTGHEADDCDLDEDAVYVDASACSDNYLVSVYAILIDYFFYPIKDIECASYYVYM